MALNYLDEHWKADRQAKSMAKALGVGPAVQGVSRFKFWACNVAWALVVLGLLAYIGR